MLIYYALCRKETHHKPLSQSWYTWPDIWSSESRSLLPGLVARLTSQPAKNICRSFYHMIHIKMHWFIHAMWEINLNFKNLTVTKRGSDFVMLWHQEGNSISLFHHAFFNSIVDEYQHMHFSHSHCISLECWFQS